MVCSCGRDNAGARRYCGDCGAALQLACGRCGFQNDQIDRYCGGCGDSMPAGATAARPGTSKRSAGPTAHVIPAIPAGEPEVRFANRSAPAVARVPRPAPPVPPLALSPVSDDVEVVGEDELRQLLADSEQEKPDVDLPKGRVTQDDLDRLFGDAV